MHCSECLQLTHTCVTVDFIILNWTKCQMEITQFSKHKGQQVRK